MIDFDKYVENLKRISESPEFREEFWCDMYTLRKREPENYTEFLTQLEQVNPYLAKEVVDFFGNVDRVLKFVETAESRL